MRITEQRLRQIIRNVIKEETYHGFRKKVPFGKYKGLEMELEGEGYKLWSSYNPKTDKVGNEDFNKWASRHEVKDLQGLYRACAPFKRKTGHPTAKKSYSGPFVFGKRIVKWLQDNGHTDEINVVRSHPTFNPPWSDFPKNEI